MKTLKMFALISAVALAATFTACVTKDNTPPPPEQPMKQAETAKPNLETKTPADTTKPADTPKTAGDDLAAKGKVIFEGAGACAGCHGKDGKPTLQLPNIPNFTDAAWQKAGKEDVWTASLKNGKGAMPKFAGAEADIPAVLAYVRQLGGVKPATK